MSNIKKLLRFHELAEEYIDMNNTYRGVVVDLPEDTVITVTWEIDGPERFKSRDFPISDLPGITEKLQGKVYYKRSKNDTQATNQ